MKTKFSGTIPDHKQTRNKLRNRARSQLAGRADQVGNTSDYSKLKLAVYYMLPLNDLRGFLSVAFNDRETLRYYLSPGERVGFYVADKIEFVYSDNDQAVSLDITRTEEWARDLFGWLESKGRIVNAILAAQQAKGWGDYS